MKLTLQTRVALGVALALGGAVAALPWYSGYVLARQVHELAASHAQGELVVRNLAHVQGWLSSHGALDVEWRSQCDDAGQGPALVHLEYRASHVPDAQGWSQIDWTAAPGAASTAQGYGPLTGHGLVDYQGQLRTDMQLPAVQLVLAGQQLQAQASSGHLVLKDTHWQLDWAVPQLRLQRESSSFQADDVRLALDVHGRNTMAGTVALDAAQLRMDDLVMRGVHVSSQSAERGDRIDTKLVQSVQQLAFQDYSFKDWVLEFDVKGLHTDSAQAVSAVVSKSCGLQTISPQDQQALRVAIKKLLASGLSFGIPKLQGSGKDGGVQGKLEITVVSAQGAVVSLAQQLSAQGSLRLLGNVLSAEQREAALASGYVQVADEGMLADFSYGAGVLIVSGKTQDGSLVQLGLQKIDAGLQAFLEDIQAPATDAAVASPPAEALARTPAASASAASAPILPASAPATGASAPPATPATPARAAANGATNVTTSTATSAAPAPRPAASVLR